jgi:limonene-1,2-epoxide hydrolase
MEGELVALEEQFWVGDAAFYEQNLAPDALMVFPDPVGAMTRHETVASISESARWRSVEMSEVRVLTPADGVAVLAYRADAVRDEPGSRYTARIASVYVDRGDGWKLSFHQHAPT